MKLLQAWCALIFALGVLLMLQGPYMMWQHDYDAPSYHHHNHHLCHVYTISLCLCAWWWLAVVVLLWKHAREQEWARRLLGLPVALLLLVGAVTAWYVLLTLTNHDEVTFAAVMGLANGATLAVLAGYCLSLVQVAVLCVAMFLKVEQYPLRFERDYAWNYLLVCLVFQVALFGVFYWNRLKMEFVMTGVASVFGAAGLYKSKFVLVQKTL